MSIPQPIGNQSESLAQSESSEFIIQRLYIKDLSLEAPNSPKIFLEEWNPNTQMDLDTKTKKIDNETHEVVLRITVTVMIKEKTAFLVEVKQAGIFTLKGFSTDQEHLALGSFCPTILYPYAREVITDVVIKAGYPPLYLSPVNFDALLAAKQDQIES